jgi:hypothetical protein
VEAIKRWESAWSREAQNIEQVVGGEEAVAFWKEWEEKKKRRLSGGHSDKEHNFIVEVAASTHVQLSRESFESLRGSGG